VALSVREELARRRLRVSGWPTKPGSACPRSEKALAGSRPFTLATVSSVSKMRLAQAYSARREDRKSPKMFAPETDGRITRPGGSNGSKGTYLTMRPSFSEDGAIFAYLTSISWSERAGHLVFSEAQRTDAEYEQKGFVSFPQLSGRSIL
jgi:hypothetical protein